MLEADELEGSLEAVEIAEVLDICSTDVVDSDNCDVEEEET
jgi:hypothetical protein